MERLAHIKDCLKDILSNKVPGLQSADERNKEAFNAISDLELFNEVEALYNAANDLIRDSKTTGLISKYNTA